MIQQQALFSYAWPNSSKLFSRRFSTISSCQIYSPHQVCPAAALKKWLAPHSGPSPFPGFYKATSLHPIIPSALNLQEVGHGVLASANAHSFDFTCNMTAPKPIRCLQSTVSLPALVLHFQQGMLVTPIVCSDKSPLPHPFPSTLSLNICIRQQVYLLLHALHLDNSQLLLILFLKLLNLFLLLHYHCPCPRTNSHFSSEHLQKPFWHIFLPQVSVPSAVPTVLFL